MRRTFIPKEFKPLAGGRAQANTTGTLTLAKFDPSGIAATRRYDPAGINFSCDQKIGGVVALNRTGINLRSSFHISV